jgi:hypothetical protein
MIAVVISFCQKEKELEGTEFRVGGRCGFCV